jgi:hypothetical protein
MNIHTFSNEMRIVNILSRLVEILSIVFAFRKGLTFCWLSNQSGSVFGFCDVASASSSRTVTALTNLPTESYVNFAWSI